ncbi:hypothetical protein [Metabacillus litoralis]|uniref:hypothetical protein n=1 Tax=Metabacillus litoralis TaxID=152268 RepID=UPI001CFCE535|nr:hypothetical protein [Metabacillus litoralis]
MKIFITGCIFSSLFTGAWFVNEKLRREYVEQIVFEESIIELTNTETPIEEINVFEKFGPREYVRVVLK